ncbi:uncharacterized protein LOC123528017 [Mercenaria mercenaria]|uniref:uncharacterized protein LOC123528017 n=1 Tax=Mercenaria mercenaria TaxID=6596 RepID=UPI00234E52AE|nr:uncharacterized protein LOC123528017 [Mercenaria mercenaria]
MEDMLLYFMIVLVYVARPVMSECAENGTSCNKFECEYNVIRKLIKLEEKVSQQDEKIVEQNKKHVEQAHMIETLSRELEGSRRALEYHISDGSAYIRWGRKTCPSGATLVYEGYTAGTHYTYSGGAAQPLCLTTKPIWGLHTSKQELGAYVYGAEYQTSSYSAWNYLHNHDVPCVVCRVPNKDVLMVPGSSSCPNAYNLQYSGYLMAGYYSHAASSHYLCVDGNPETVDRGYQDNDGYLLYFVQAICGSLACGPYVLNREITCAVCSFSLEA